MARRVQLTYTIWVGDGDDNDCIDDAEEKLEFALGDDDLSAFGFERVATVTNSDGSSSPQVEKP